MTAATTNQVTIKGITYDVTKRETTEQIAASCPHLADNMVKRGWVGSIHAKRPRGRKASMFYYDANGIYTHIITV